MQRLDWSLIMHIGILEFFCFNFIGLRQFLCLVTENASLTNTVEVEFTSREYDEAISIHTCSNYIVLSTNIADMEQLKMDLNILVKDVFTMACLCNFSTVHLYLITGFLAHLITCYCFFLHYPY